MKIVHGINERRKKQKQEFYDRRTAAQNAARERKRLIESEGFYQRPYTAEDQPEIPIQVIVIDHRCNRVIEADFFRRRRIDSFQLAIGDEPIGAFGASRGMREIAKRIGRILQV